MAKLNGVKTVDMVNGEITKVAYEGAEYAKVDGLVKSTEDILLAIENGLDRTKGEFYRVISVGNTVRWEDNTSANGVGAEYIGDRFNVFRKISESKPTLEQVAKRVESLESDVAALKSGETSVEPKRLTVGDTAKIIGNDSGHFGNIGDIVKIVTDDEDGQPYQCERVSDGKDVGWFYEEDLVAHAVETIEFEGATYRKVDREAREGDVVVFRKNRSVSVKNNKPYLVQQVKVKVAGGTALGVMGNCGCHVYHDDYNRTRETVDVYEPIEQAKYVPQEGDIVVIVKSEHGSRNSVGDIGKVSNVSRVNFAVDVPQKPKAPKASGNKHVAYEVRKATPAEVEQYEQAVHKASFAVGDYVKVVKSESGNEGKIAKITDDSDGLKMRLASGDVVLADFEGTSLEDGKVYGFTTDQIVKATDAEIAKATAPKLKAGDFVKFRGDEMGITAGKLYEVNEEHGELSITDDDGDWRHGGVFSDEHEILSAEEAKWAKIGRKVGEIRKGDIVKVTSNCGRHSIGTIGIAQSNGDTESTSVLANGIGTSTWSFVELIAPVESLINA